MSVNITVPQLGESIVEATVGQWLKHEGDEVAAGEPLVTLETDKVNVEVPAPASGVLAAVSRHEGDTVAIGAVLAQLDERSAAQPAPATQPQPAAVAIAANGGAPRTPSTSLAPEAAHPHPADMPATPLARRMADEHGVDLRDVAGSGAGGRITHDDVAAYLTAHPQSQPPATRNGQPAPHDDAPAPLAQDRSARTASAAVTARASSTAVAAPADAAGPADAAALPSLEQTLQAPREERIRMSRRRLTIARRLVEAQHTAAMLTTFNEVDMSAILGLRARRRDAFKERHGVSLGFMSFFTRAVVGALKAFPRLNAEIQGDEIVLKRYYDIGIAVSTDEGLVVPVVRDVDRLSFAEIEERVADLAARARANTLGLADVQGGTFTITNGGTFGSLLSTPILNVPQVGILGMHKIEERPIAVNGQVVIHPMMYVALSYDHRIVDGSESVRFLVRVKELLEDPETLLLEA
jgi:2-oxoglutarate dehydrogenase E2 component (dihydrolipoamide succinyltransferase)